MPETNSPDYLVRPGDTLSSIALAHGTTVRELAMLNGLAPDDPLQVGMRLALPQTASSTPTTLSSAGPSDDSVPPADREPAPTPRVSTGDSDSAFPEVAFVMLGMLMVLVAACAVTAAVVRRRVRGSVASVSTRTPPNSVLFSVPPRTRPTVSAVAPRPSLAAAGLGAPALAIASTRTRTERERPTFRVDPIGAPAAVSSDQDPIARRWTGDVIGRPPALPPAAARPVPGAGWPAGIVSDFGAVGGLVFRGGSVRGEYGRAAGSPRQDSFAIGTTAGGALVIAVADGVGGAAHSELGSATAVLSATALLVDSSSLPSSGELSAVFSDVAAAIVGEAAARSDIGDPAALATTLVVVVIDGRDFVAGRVGDSNAWTVTDGAWSSLFATEAPVVADTRTAALPMSVSPQLCVGRMPVEGPLVVATDGVGEPLGTGDTPVGRYLAAAWRTPPDPLHFLQTMSFRSRTFDDDRTAVAVWTQR